jgi:uroporphyrinogen-III synthase
MPLSKYNLLCTSPLEQMVLDKAAEKGMGIDMIPLIKTEPILSPEVINQIQTCQLQKATVIFTSINAVNAVTHQLTEKPDWTIFSIGGITKEAVYKFFGEKSVVATAKNAAALSEKILAYPAIHELIFFCGDQRLNGLPEKLIANKLQVKEIIVYSTIEIHQQIEKNYPGIAFFSPSAVNSFFSVNTIDTKTILFSIGKTTTATIKSYCNNQVETSEWPGKQQLIEKAIEYFEKINQL